MFEFYFKLSSFKWKIGCFVYNPVQNKQAIDIFKGLPLKNDKVP